MSKLAYISHPICLKHNTGVYHPESANRLNAIDSHLNKSGFFKKIDIFEPDVADEKIISISHDQTYISKVKSAIENGVTVLDQGDTIVSEYSFSAAEYAAGAVIKGIDLIKSKILIKYFVRYVRPVIMQNMTGRWDFAYLTILLLLLNMHNKLAWRKEF
jgi:acetoin utilization deacetylase AcuC-like enzyme